VETTQTKITTRQKENQRTDITIEAQDIQLIDNAIDQINSKILTSVQKFEK